MSAAATPNADAAAQFILGMRERALPAPIAEAARMCVVDWIGVALAGASEPAAIAVQTVVRRWGGTGNASILLGGQAPAGAAAMVNGTMGHCLDFDDTHVGSLAHLSSPVLAAALAVGMDRGASPTDILRAFVTGFEVGARFGTGAGPALNERAIHSTGFFGCIGAAAAAAFLLDLDAAGIRNALGAAATQASGLTDSFGTMAKPFHAGKAAFNGILAADLAAAGLTAAPALLEPGGGLSAALIQDGSAGIPPVSFDDGWEITRNTFKPYAACLLTHPAIDAARRLAEQVGAGEVEGVRVGVHPLAVQLAGNPDPRTPLEAKFSLAFCVALGLAGHAASQGDFSPARLADPLLRGLTARVAPVITPTLAKTAGWVEVLTRAGTLLRADIPVALGNPENPMSWDDMRAKFLGLTEPVLAAAAQPLFAALRRFDAVDAYQVFRMSVIGGAPNR